ncbi:WxL domain-containing protein [Enterococcus sp. AZ109]|uniref:WxL domain-containing protein n=1 Tax=Enterococcus sp. AZ109 TaxID=2774634 RepID=UPI003F1E5302
MKKNQLITTTAATILAVTTLGGVTVSHAAESSEYTSNGAVKFVPNTDPTLPVNPEKPDPNIPVDPIDPTDPDGPNSGTDGPLSIDYASSFDFGLNKISNKDETYFARAQTYKGSTPATANYVQVSDNRGNNGGWVLKVKQNSQFTAETTTLNHVLTGAAVTLDNPTVASNSSAVAPIAEKPITLNPNGAEAVVLSAVKNSGAGTWINRWGTVESVTEKGEDGTDIQANVTKDVSLFVPGSTPKDAVNYTTTLTWNLSDIPENI